MQPLSLTVASKRYISRLCTIQLHAWVLEKNILQVTLVHVLLLTMIIIIWRKKVQKKVSWCFECYRQTVEVDWDIGFQATSDWKKQIIKITHWFCWLLHPQVLGRQQYYSYVHMSWWSYLFKVFIFKNHLWNLLSKLCRGLWNVYYYC